MKKIYRDQNYIIIEADGQILALPATQSIYSHVITGEDRQEAALFIRGNGGSYIIIESDIIAGNWEDDASNAYSVASMIIFLRTNTGY
jgi:hypothetical protein